MIKKLTSYIKSKAIKEKFKLKNILAFIANFAFKCFIFYWLFVLVGYYGCFSNQFGVNSEYLSYFVAYFFVIILLIFQNSLYQKFKFIFLKKVFFLAVIIYIIAISNAFYQSSSQIQQLRDDASYKKADITYEFDALLTSLTPRVKISLDKTYNKSKSYKIATKLFDSPFNSRLEYYYFTKDGYKNNEHVCFYNQQRGQFITVLQRILWLYLHIFAFHFLMAKKIVFKRKIPFIGFGLMKVRRVMLVLWFVFLFLLVTMYAVIRGEIYKPCHGIDCINYSIRNSDTKIKGNSYENLNLIKKQKDEL